MRIGIPNMPESLSYSLVAAIGVSLFAALVLIFGSGDLVAALLVLALAAAIHWLVARNPVTIVSAKEAAATILVLLVLCALADLATGNPYQAVLFLLAAGALGFAFLLLQQGTAPVELRLGGVLIVAAPGRGMHLHMLEELRDAGILTADEFAEKRRLIEP